MSSSTAARLPRRASVPQAFGRASVPRAFGPAIPSWPFGRRPARVTGAPEALERNFRPDVQGLRALAVGVVVVFHVFPHVLSGGFVGVDVFFAISGYLITGHLLRQHDRTGRVRLLDFYGRRARRLMPAAVLVLTVTWLVARVVEPASQLPATADQVRASALYYQNWLLAHDAVDYFTSAQATSPVQHYWSLSVEEQFYLVWPAMFLLAALVMWLVRRARPGLSDARHLLTGRVALAVLAALIVAASLAWSVHDTAVDPAAAYYVTTTRMWELGLGALLAVVAERWQQRIGRFGLLSWAGLAMIVWAAVEFSGSTPYPGIAALLPVGGAVLLLACGSPFGRFGSFRLMSLRPLVFLGDISYSLYLWHFPLVVLWKDHSGHQIGPRSGAAIIVVSVLLAWLTTRLVEDPVRLSRFFVRHAYRSIATVVAVLLPVLLVTTYLDGLPGTASTTKLVVQEPTKYPGAAVLAGDAHDVPHEPFLPTVTEAPHNYGYYGSGPGGCQTPQGSSYLTTCYWADTSHPRKVVALVGDSVAGEWFGPIVALAKREHWELVTSLHSLCPWTATLTRVPSDHDQKYTSCQTWGRNLLTALTTKIKPALVITSARPTVRSWKYRQLGQPGYALIAQGMATYWRDLQRDGIAVAGIRESPEMGFDVPTCLSKPGATIAGCSRPASKAVIPGTPVLRATRLDPAATLINPIPYICSPTRCDPVVGNVEVYIDFHHITNTYALTVGPYLDRLLLRIPALSSGSS